MMLPSNNYRIRIIAAGVLIVVGCVAVAPLRTEAQEAKEEEARGKSSYDQISPVLLGQQIVCGHDGQGQGRQGRRHGPAAEAARRALRPDAAPGPEA